MPKIIKTKFPILKLLKDIKIGRKLLYSYFIFMMPVVILGMFVFFKTYDFVNRETINKLELISDQVSNDLESKLDKYNNFFTAVMYDIRLNRYIRGEESNSFLLFSSQYYKLFDHLEVAFKNITIYTHLDVYDTQIVQPIDNIKEEEWYNKVLQYNDAIIYPKEGELIMAEKFPNIFEHDSIISATIKPNLFFYSITKNDTINCNIWIYDMDNEQTIYFKKSPMGKREYPLEFSPQFRDHIASGKDFFKADSDSYIIKCRLLKGTNLLLCCYVPGNVQRDKYVPIVKVTLMLMLISVMLILLWLSFLRSTLIKPIKELNSEMKLISKGDFDRVVLSDSKDEVGQLVNQFSQMAMKLKELINKVYISEIQAREMQLCILKAQINPHFLYNCLSAINMHALRIDATNISDIVTSLSTFYRTALSRGKDIITLAEEVENTKSYINILLNIRGHDFDVSYRIPDDIHKYETLNLIMQPLVENAVEHGIDKVEIRGLIEISVIIKETTIEIIVVDNGRGMTAEQLNEILTTDSTGYGIKNIQQRIHLKYGKEYGLSYKSALCSGTTAKVILPKE